MTYIGAMFNGLTLALLRE